LKGKGIRNHRGHGETLCVLKKQEKGQRLGRGKRDSLAEDEVIFRENGINQLEGPEGSGYLPG
jgi:hypothetical protein